MSNLASARPFLPVENLLRKVINRYWASKNRSKSLEGYAHIYMAFLDFHKKVEELLREFEQGMVDNGIIDLPRQTLFLTENETKIEAITPEVPKLAEDVDIATANLVVFEVGKMSKDDFAFLRGYRK